MLPDLLKPELNVVLYDTAIGERSAEKQLNYTGRGKKFWRTLHEVGLRPSQLIPRKYRELLNYGIGLTDLVKHKAGKDS